jgi:hypothetical protein
MATCSRGGRVPYLSLCAFISLASGAADGVGHVEIAPSSESGPKNQTEKAFRNGEILASPHEREQNETQACPVSLASVLGEIEGVEQQSGFRRRDRELRRTDPGGSGGFPSERLLTGTGVSQFHRNRQSRSMRHNAAKIPGPMSARPAAPPRIELPLDSPVNHLSLADRCLMCTARCYVTHSFWPGAQRPEHPRPDD